ncbi:MAG: hypothetical protein NC250_05540 [Alistipes senegalensis]|nr:hypothetical protein [Bacteroides cellulosilyticus]MCM1352175.1 hypothetical protein [Alistipes senegalensis]
MFSCRRIFRISLLLLLLLPSAVRVAARPHPYRGWIDSAKLDAVAAPHDADTLDTRVTERNQRLYDSIASKTHRTAVSRMLYRLLFTERHTNAQEAGGICDETRLLAPYAGKIIGEIRIERKQPFDTKGNWLERTGNKLHSLTHESIIRRDLLFSVGQRFDPELVVRTQQLLLSRPYIADTEITVEPDPHDAARVDIVLQVRDSWSISIDAALYSEKRLMLGLTDGNIFGTGTRLKVETNLKYNTFDYGGNIVEYEMPNLLGSFFTFDVRGGRNFFENTLRVSLRKEFLKPTDYEVGATYTEMRSKKYFLDRDSSLLVKVRDLDLWAGWSKQLPGIRSNVFVTARYNYRRFMERPEVAANYNPALHDYDDLLSGIGLYRERLFMTNMVYGFGRKEYVATGYKAEVVTGHTWGEFDQSVYLGVGFRTGGFRHIGYLMGGFTLGSHIDRSTGAWNRNAVDIDVLWFSNLLTVRRSRVRQFLALNYTQGWNRKLGYEENIGFTGENGLQALDRYAIGTNRLVLNTETVVFTPIQPWGFRFAFFGFLDGGTLGYAANPFRNPGFASFGLGLRIKNERLIFGTLQIRLGMAFGKGGLVDTDWFSLSNTKHFAEYRFRPTRPEIVGFK